MSLHRGVLEASSVGYLFFPSFFLSFFSPLRGIPAVFVACAMCATGTVQKENIKGPLSVAPSGPPPAMYGPGSSGEEGASTDIR